MSTNKASFGPAAALTIGLTGLANGAARESLEVDNSATKYLDALLEFSFTLAVAAGARGSIDIYLAASLDGALWPDTVTGADAAYVLKSLDNLLRMGAIDVPAGTVGPFKAIWPTSMGPNAALLLPPWWSIVVVNNSGQAFAAGCTVRFLGGQVSEE